MTRIYMSCGHYPRRVHPLIAPSLTPDSRPFLYRVIQENVAALLAMKIDYSKILQIPVQIVDLESRVARPRDSHLTSTFRTDGN